MPSVCIVVMTAPRRRPERAALLGRTVTRALEQRLPLTTSLELLVLDDGPEAAGWPAVWSAAEVSSSTETRERPVRLRYVAVAPDAATGRVNMRLKRNLALHLCQSDHLLFFDDDDWRSADAAQAQLEALASSGGDMCTVQVQYVCEIDPRAPAPIRYYHTPDGADIFSARLGNPGSMLLSRSVWEESPELGFPDTPCEDVDYARLLTEPSTLLSRYRSRCCINTLLDARELSESQRQPTMMCVRLIGFSHEWPLRPLEEREERDEEGSRAAAPRRLTAPPSCLSEDDVRFYGDFVRGLQEPPQEPPQEPFPLERGASSAPPPPPPPPPPPGLEAALQAASRRMQNATLAIRLVDAARLQAAAAKNRMQAEPERAQPKKQAESKEQAESEQRELPKAAEGEGAAAAAVAAPPSFGSRIEESLILSLDPFLPYARAPFFPYLTLKCSL